MTTGGPPSQGVLTTARNAERPRALFEFTQGIAVDSPLAESEVRVQKAWARALVPVGALTAAEFTEASGYLDEALARIRAGSFAWRVEDEDIHMNLERFLTEKAGALGKKIHWGRSRNDLIATTLRLDVADRLVATQAQVRELGRAILDQARACREIAVPGMTHRQAGQPVRFAQIWLAVAEGLTRDLARLEFARAEALAACPLGAGAVAGTALAIDLEAIASELGFSQPLLNSIDAVGDRDFILTAVDAWKSLALRLSRLSDEIIFWSSTPVGWLKLPREWSTGSSLMPNKRNPDVAELTRGRAAHVLGAATEAAALLKGLPISYGSDLHELKDVYQRAHREVSAVLGVYPQFTRGLQPDADRCRAALAHGHILATELADALVRQGKSFRDAYAQVAAWVEQADARGVQVEAVVPEALRAEISVPRALEARCASGGTALAQVEASIGRLARAF